MVIGALKPHQPHASQRQARSTESAAAEPQDSIVFQLPEKAGGVRGHLASDPQHALCPSSQYPLRTYMLTGNNQVAAVDFRDIFENLKSRAYPSQNGAEQLQFGPYIFETRPGRLLMDGVVG